MGLGLIVPSGSVAGGEEPDPVGGGGVEPTAAAARRTCGFAVDGTASAATGGIGAVDDTMRWGGGRSVGFSAWATSTAVGARTSARSLIDSVRFIAGNDDGIGRGRPACPVSITSVESSLSGAAVFKGAGAAGSRPISRVAGSASVC